MVFLDLRTAYKFQKLVQRGLYIKGNLKLDENEFIRETQNDEEYPFLITSSFHPMAFDLIEFSDYSGSVFFATRWGFWILDTSETFSDDTLAVLSNLEKLRPFQGSYPQYEELCPLQKKFFDNLGPFIFMDWDSILREDFVEI